MAAAKFASHVSDTRSSSADAVTIAFGLRNVTDTDRGIAEMVRVTQPGGRVAILEFSRPRGRLLGGLYGFYFRRVLPKIGQLFGGRDHTTVMHANRKIREQMAEKRSTFNQVTELTNRIKQQATGR